MIFRLSYQSKSGWRCVQSLFGRIRIFLHASFIFHHLFSSDIIFLNQDPATFNSSTSTPWFTYVIAFFVVIASVLGTIDKPLPTFPFPYLLRKGYWYSWSASEAWWFRLLSIPSILHYRVCHASMWMGNPGCGYNLTYWRSSPLFCCIWWSCYKEQK